LQELTRVVGRLSQWAELPSERIARKRAERAANGGRGDSESEEEELLSEEEGDGALEAMGRSTGALTKGVAVGGMLPPGELRVTRLGDANKVRVCFAPSLFPLVDARVAAATVLCVGMLWFGGFWMGCLDEKYTNVFSSFSTTAEAAAERRKRGPPLAPWQVEPSHAVVRSVQFHPNGQMLLTAGLDKSLRLFQIDGGRNPKVQTVFLEDLPIHKAAFSADGAQVSGRSGVL